MIKHNTLSIVLVLVVLLMIALTAFPDLLRPIYVALPVLMALIAIMMFVSGYYYGNDNSGQSSSETTTTTSTPDGSDGSGRYASSRRVEQTHTQKSSRSN